MLRPMRDMVVIAPEAEETETASGIIKTGGSDKQTSYGQVLALHDNVHNLHVGDRVLYNRYMAEDVLDGENELKVVSINDILCVIA